MRLSILPAMAVNSATRAALPSFRWVPSHTELLRTLVRRELRARFKGSALGLLWSLLYPLAMMAVYTLVFSVLWKVTGDIPHYPLFVLAGLAVWGFFQAGIQLGTTSLVANGELIKKVWFPRELVPGSLLYGVGSTGVAVFNVLILGWMIASKASTYGALGIAATLLLGFFLVGRIMVVAAVLNATVHDRRAR